MLIVFAHSQYTNLLSYIYGYSNYAYIYIYIYEELLIIYNYLLSFNNFGYDINTTKKKLKHDIIRVSKTRVELRKSIKLNLLDFFNLIFQFEVIK